MFFLYILDVKFDLYNLYKLRVVHSDDSNDKQRFSINVNNEFKIEKVKNKLKDYDIINLI